MKIYTGPAGTVTRFATALLCVTPGQFTLDGNERMRERPMGELIECAATTRREDHREGQTKAACRLQIAGASLRGGKCRLKLATSAASFCRRC